MIDWDRIDGVFLDMDGTLLDLNFDNHFWQEFVPQRYAELHGVALSQAKRLLSPRFKAMEGRLEWYCLDYWSEELRLDLAGLKQEIAGLIAVLPHVTEFLEAVRRLGKRLILVTNAHPRSLSLKMERTCLHTFFDTIVCSHAFGYPKEAPDFWFRLNQAQPFDRQRSLLVDDSPAVLAAAREYGLAVTIAIRKADSRRPARRVEGFLSIDDFRELMPARSA